MRTVLGLFIIVAIVALLLTGTALAQESAPDYSIRNIRSRFLDSGQITQIQFEVWNIGGAAASITTAELRVADTGEVLAEQEVAPLQSQEIVTVTLVVPPGRFEPKSSVTFEVSLGFGDIEPPNTENAQDNIARITVTIPVPSQPSEPGSTPAPAVPSLEETIRSVLAPLNLQVDLSDPAQVVVLVGVCAGGLVLLFLLVVIIRLIFGRQPAPAVWQPPYASPVLADPNTQMGRRQQWQFHAQNSQAPVLAAAEDTLQIRKLLSGVDGTNLAGWQVTGLYLVQYDMYGRIHRSQVQAGRSAVKRLNGVIRQRAQLSPEQTRKRLRPVAADLVKRISKKWTDRTVMLPLALDIRWQGRVGEAQIWFELMRCQRGIWYILDRWMPEMSVTGKTLEENFTYTLAGLRGGETRKRLPSRLEEDLILVFLDVLSPQAVQAAPPPRSPAPTDPHLKPLDTTF
jgi:hypothetical protein